MAEVIKMLLKTDERRRITIPPEAGISPGETVDLEVLSDGRVLLVPMVTIPKHQLWAWTPENRKKVADSLADPRPSTIVATAADAKKLAKDWDLED
ncbi:MAG: AbrB/MazE/SpoVT family DNA-binding domain-containing protein [Candidatus Methylomirabilia bacterium]